MRRYIYWFGGFVSLFVFNVFVEFFVLPAMDLDNTEKNDIYFQLWWLVVILWLLLGLRAVDKVMSNKPAENSVEAP